MKILYNQTTKGAVMPRFELSSSQENLETRGIQTIILGEHATGIASRTGYAEKHGDTVIDENPVIDDQEPYESNGFGD